MWLTVALQVDKKRLNTVKESIRQGFSWAAREGPLCEERESTFSHSTPLHHNKELVRRHHEHFDILGLHPSLPTGACPPSELAGITSKG